MADAIDVRAWAIPQNLASSRGKLSSNAIEGWNVAHPDDPYQANNAGFTGNGTTVADYPDDDFDAMFPDPDGGLGDTGETKPRKPVSKGKGKAAGGWNPFAKGKAKPAGKRPPRVSTEDIWGALWRGGAKLLTPLPPIQRTLRMQAPVAGALMDDVTKATFVDPLLQPLARLAGQGKTVQALAGPPVFVGAICVEQMRAAAEERDPNPLIMAIATEGLRSSLMAWMDVAGPKFDEAMKREAEFEAQYGARVDDMIALIFSPPPDPRDADAVAAEEEAIRRAQGIL